MIYVLRIQNQKKGFFKVGKSDDPSKRMPDIQTNSPFKLSLVSLKLGGLKEEKALHKLLKTNQTNGEWFSDTPETRSILEVTHVHQEMKKDFVSQTGWFKVLTFLECNKKYSFDAEMLCRCLGVDIQRIETFYHNKKMDAPFRLESVSEEDAYKVNLVGPYKKGQILAHPDLFNPILGAYDNFWQGHTRVTPFNHYMYPHKKLGEYTF